MKRFLTLILIGSWMVVIEYPLSVVGESAPETVPGVVIDHVPASTGQYIGSPSLAILPDGRYVASHDLFGKGSTWDRTVVFLSADKGETWKKTTEITGQWWSTLFFHKGALYLMGTSREYGFCVIRKSMDGGATWTTPTDKTNGLLFDDGKYHTAPVPVLIHNGRLWRAMEDAQGPGDWGSHFRAFMMSAPVDSNLLRADSWTSSNRLGRDPSWLGGTFGGWLEGNAVATPQGKIVDILRADSPSYDEKAAVIEISEDGTRASFDPASGFVSFPGGSKKFTIRYDPESSLYWSLVNAVPETFRKTKAPATRNTVALVCSSDLQTWQVKAQILHHPDVVVHGFQYLDWQFEGSDLAVVCRTAFDDGLGGAHNFHDANYMTFHRIKGFRTLMTASGSQ
jgi:hypothetical protein